MKQLTIGRSPDSDLQVSEAYPRVSNNHATIELIDGALTLTDHSTNGTTINGTLVHQQQVTLTNGDEILLAGDYRLMWPTLLNFFPELPRRTIPFDLSTADPSTADPTTADPRAKRPRNPTGSASTPYPSIADPSIADPSIADPSIADPRAKRPRNPTGEQRGGYGAGAYQAGLVVAGAPAAQMPAQIPAQMAAPAAAATNSPGAPAAQIPARDAGQLNSLTQAEIDEVLDSFSPAAALGTWVWGLFNGLYWPLAIIPLSLIPFAGQVLSIFFCTYLGLNGNRIGWQHAKGLPFPVWYHRQRSRLWIFIATFVASIAVQLFAFYWIMNYIL